MIDAGVAELEAGHAGAAVALLEAAQAHTTAAAAAGRLYDRTDPPTGMAAHEYYDKALRAAVDAPLAKASEASFPVSLVSATSCIYHA